MSKTRKFTGFNRNERTIPAGVTTQFAALVYTCEDQGGETVVSVHVEIALGQEPPTATGAANVAGYARLCVNRAGNVIPLIQPNVDWDTVTVADTLNDEDSGDTWAITPFALGGSVQPVAFGAVTGGAVHLVLSPKTKRSLRKGDEMYVELNYSNGGGVDNAIIQEAVTGTTFIQGD